MVQIYDGLCMQHHHSPCNLKVPVIIMYTIFYTFGSYIKTFLLDDTVVGQLILLYIFVSHTVKIVFKFCLY